MKSFEKIPAPPPPIEPEPNREASLWGYPVKIKETIGQIAERTVKLDEELLEPSVKEAKRHLLSQESSVATYTLSKISDRLGSNEGGWYKNTETGENLYVKVYNHPDQARTEYLANSIYRHLGINAPEPHLIDWDDMGESDVIFLAFASSEARGWPLSELDMRWNESVRAGFVADAYLANWDVIGLTYDNILDSRDNPGTCVRIDNGGSMEYRAQGDRKQFQRDVIPELETMRKNSFTSGRVFGDISEAEMKGQAISLVKKLTDSEIENLVDKAGFDEDYAYVLKAKLKGRRQFLIKRFKIEEENRERPMPVGRERVAKALDRISNTEREKLENIGFNPRVSLLADTDYIENQQIDIIEQEGQYVVQFKINQAKLDDAKSAIIDYCRYARCEEGLIQYVDMRVDKLGQLDFLIGNAKVTALSDDAWVKVSRGEKRSSVGLVQIEIKKGEDPVKTKELIGTYIDQAFSQIFDKKEALLPPPPESTTDYMLNRRAWLWKRQPGELKDEEVQEVLATSKRAEVFPNYWTVVEEGAHLKYWDEHGPYAIFHKIFSLARLPLMIKSGGLLSSHERFRRGLLIAGESSSSDFQYGGADSVFVRTAVEQAINNGKKQKRFTSAISGSPCLIFSPEIFDRTDWYAYEGDNYGSTEPDKFNRRQTPGELFSEQKDKYYSSSNEQMFRLGIPFEHVIGISCSVDDRDEIIELLKSNGINEINNQPIEEFVVVATNELEVIEVTKKYMAGNKSKKYEEYEVTQEDMEYKRKGKRPNKL